MILKIGSFSLPVMGAFDIAQTYTPLKSESIFRTISQRGIKQSTPNKKLRISTTGTGWIPSGLEAIDTDQQHQLACISPRMLAADLLTRQAVLPVGRRGDLHHLPYGLAMFSNHRVQRTPAVMTGNTATLDAVPGAVAYQVCYYPLLLCWIGRPTISGPDFRWEFEAEEV